MSYQKCTFIFFIIFAVALEKMEGSPQKLVHGSVAGRNEFPYQVSLRKNGQHFCGGAIIGPKHILTAAHCLKKEIQMGTIKSISVVTGTNSLLHGGTGHKIKNATPHPRSDNYWLNDIAVITLFASIIFNNLQQPIKLASQDYPAGSSGVLAGWGHAKEGASSLEVELLKINSTLAKIFNCQSYVKESLSDKHVCTFPQSGQGFCNGDSGGPLVINEEAVGIVSFSHGCADNPDVYTKVFPYKQFIEKEMGIFSIPQWNQLGKQQGNRQRKPQLNQQWNRQGNRQWYQKWRKK